MRRHGAEGRWNGTGTVGIRETLARHGVRRTAPGDPQVLAGAAGLLLVTAILACYIPARRAARVDPVRTLSAQ